VPEELSCPVSQSLFRDAVLLPCCGISVSDDAIGQARIDLLLTTYHLPLTTYHLPLITYHLPLTTYCVLTASLLLTSARC